MGNPRSRSNAGITGDNSPLAVSNEHELATDQMNQLVITLHRPTRLCPVCDDEQHELEKCCDHVLQHFSLNKLEHYRILKWFSQINDDTETLRSTLDRNRVRSSNGTKIFEVNELYISLPPVIPHSRCIFCEKFFKLSAIKDHVFDHLNFSASTRKKILIWFSDFFKSEDGRAIETIYAENFNKARLLNSYSTLLEELPNFKNTHSNTCRYCKLQTFSPEELYSHCVEWHIMSPNDSWNCVICNFKTADVEVLLNHIDRRHIVCICCRKRFESFASCFSHLCRNGRERRSVICPCCKKQEFISKNDMDQHIISDECKPWLTSNTNEHSPCSNKLKKRPKKSILIDCNSIKEFIQPERNGKK